MIRVDRIGRRFGLAPEPFANRESAADRPRLRGVRYPGAGCPLESPGRTMLIRATGLVALGVGVAYLVWRAAATLNLSAWWIALLLLAVEIHALFSFGLFLFSLWDVAPLTPAGTSADLSVAVLIPTYDEELAVLLPTVAAALALEPAHETWVLDDGKRSEVEEMCRSLRARYAAREGNEGAKAGNLNHALSLLDCDLVAVLDADHVPEPGFLTRTMPFFNDPGVALVQTPQDFYNLDSFEHPAARDADGDDPLARQRYHEQTLFYRVIQPGKNRWNGAFWCGTNAVVRTAALRAVGGIATDTLTEDIHTTVRLHRAGWRTVYLNEVLARGLAAKTVGAYALQRRRWGTGAMQLLKRENPLTVHGLALGQRLAYGATLLGWFDAWRTLAYLLLPPLVLLTGASPIRAQASVFAAAFAASLLLQQTALWLLGRGYHRPIAGAVYELARMPANIRATLQLLRPGRQRFRVTPKGRTASSRLREARPLIALLVLFAASFSWYAATLLGAAPSSYATPWVAHGAAFWLAVNSVLVVLTLRRATARAYNAESRASFRFPSAATASFGGRPCTIGDISMTGARLCLTAVGDPPEVGRLVVSHGGGVIELEATVTNYSGRDATVGIQFAPTQYMQLGALARLLFHDGAAAGARGHVDLAVA